MELIILSALTAAVVGIAARSGKKRAAMRPLTPEEQEKRAIADQVVVINETILK